MTIASNHLASKEPSKFEQLKTSSNYLREPLASELKNDLPFFTEGAVQILKFHGSYQQDNRDNRLKGQAKDWGMMLRLRSPGGRVPAQLFLALDELANRFGNGSMRVTTRQAFQLHGIPKQDLRTVLSTIVKNLGSTLAACGDINRNVMAPAAPYEGLGYPVARRLADDIADLLAPKAAAGAYLELWVDGEKRYKIRPSIACSKVRKRQQDANLSSGDPAEPLYGSTYMPRKFKVGVTVPGDNSIDLLTQDLGLVAFTDMAGKLRGCNVYVGGGMGRTHNKEETFARTADCLGYVKGSKILDLVQAVVALQRDNGDREQRRHGRMKYLIHDRGIDWFRQELDKGNTVFYLDFEDSVRGIYNRLKTLGADLRHFKSFLYSNPTEALTAGAREALLTKIDEYKPSLIVVDGVNAAMNIMGLDLEKNKDATSFSQEVLRPLRLHNAAIITIDHVTKSKDNRGNYAIGAQAKRADIDGCAVAVEVEIA
ncbi:MAG: NADPH-dependent assimilatory sulfite reductase hemoprotein subunit, partial [Synechococcaceae bacterium WB8_1A_041]|nr:NADPH-dependent assimilatory sulfite reductase hemoprotein subunit [Synechococcaceae bacterium WB8_1A_041]